MARSYAFWTSPAGKPHRGDDGKYAPTAILAELGQTATLAAGGAISWKFLGLHDYELALAASLVVCDPNGGEMNQSDTAGLMRDAIKSSISKAGGGKPIRPNEFLAEVDNLAAAHFRKPLENFVLTTGLSVAELPQKKIRIGEQLISAQSPRTKPKVPEALTRKTEHSEWFERMSSSSYLKIRVKTRARGVFEAVQNAFDSLNLLRGLWTLFATAGSRTLRLSTTSPKPIGIIHTGPLHLLHRPDGEPAFDNYWYEPDYTVDRKLFAPKKGWAEIDRQRRRALRTIPHLAYRQDLEQLLRRYAAALDNADLDLAFLQMWGILEKITDTVGARYDETIERAVWVYRDREIAKEMLDSLRYRRNQFVHAARSSDQSDQIAYMVKSFVDPHLIRLIRNDFQVSTLKEYGEFLSLPVDSQTLRKRREDLSKAIRFRDPQRRSSSTGTGNVKASSEQQDSSEVEDSNTN